MLALQTLNFRPDDFHQTFTQILIMFIFETDTTVSFQ